MATYFKANCLASSWRKTAGGGFFIDFLYCFAAFLIIARVDNISSKTDGSTIMMEINNTMKFKDFQYVCWKAIDLPPFSTPSETYIDPVGVVYARSVFSGSLESNRDFICCLKTYAL